MKSTVKKNVALKGIAALSVALLISFSALAPTGITSEAVKNDEPIFGNYYSSDYKSADEALKASTALNEEITAEGFTLLKNESNALPLKGNAKISLFGKNSARMLTGGSGSGAGGGGGTSCSLQESLTEAGFSLNPTLVNFYNNNSASGSGRGGAPSNGNVSPGYNTGETPISSYTSAITSSYAEYNDAAIVVISRIGGEGFDLPRTMKWNGSTYGSWGTDATQLVPGARSVDDHYLQLDANEAALMKHCGENFDTVIVLFNTGSQFETGFLDDPGHYGYHPNIKSALWIGYPGATGIRSLGKILNGVVNPSGHTVDTWARDFKADPVWMNFGNNLMEGNSSLKGNQYSNLPGSGGNGGGGHRNNYVIYKESIYMGYRYYETRGYEEGAGAYNGSMKCGTSTTTWDSWYDAHVVYPFGHGLSYTTFTQEIINSSPAADTVITDTTQITLTVRVTNTGNVAGKEVVQLYYTAPYYAGGIEKSHVVLGAIEKTNLIKPGQHEDVEITIAARDMASYDYSDKNGNGFKGYELDAGTYGIKIMENSHDVFDSVNYSIATTIKCATDSKTGNPVQNRFDNQSNYLTNGLGGEYMSRADFAGTYPTTAFRISADSWVQNGLNAQYNAALDGDTPDKPYYSSTMPTMNVDKGVQLKDLYGKDYDDPLWTTFMNQLSRGNYETIVTRGGYSSGGGGAANVYGIKAMPNADGPAGFSYGAPSATYALYCCDTVLASTWSKELAEKKGNAIGNEALWHGIVGWYAPAVNIHRSPFSGRNFEYYSEDGYLSGIMAAYVVRGAQNCGLFCYVKHFGLNDQEANRCGLLTWADEQAMREIYFRGFELTVKVGETRAMMSSLNRIGFEWAGGCHALLTQLLRDEWGFRGNVVTDSYSGAWGIADWMIRAGGNLALGSAALSYNTDSPTVVNCLRECAKGVLYAHANSLALNTASTPTVPDKVNSFNGSTLQPAVLGATYSADLGNATLSNELYPDLSDDVITYTLAEDSVLPAGLELSSDGVLSGSPTEEVNNHRFTVNASYDGFIRSAEFVISVTNVNGSIVYSAQQDLGTIEINKSCDLSVAGAEIFKPDASPEEIEAFPDISYELKNGSALPEGMHLSAKGKLSGKPTKEAKDYKFTVTATALGYKGVDLEFTINVNVPSSIATETKTLAVGQYGKNYLDRVDLVECAYPVTYSLKAGSVLPRGLTLTAAGYITGKPLQTVTDYAFTVVATADYMTPVEREYKLTIAMTFSEFEMVDAKVGEEYEMFVNFVQGVGEATYTATGLPEGLELSSDGIISGTPTEAGVYEVVITASADGIESDSITVTLYVEGEGADLSSILPIVAIGGGGVAGLGLIAVLLKGLGKKGPKAAQKKRR